MIAEPRASSGERAVATAAEAVALRGVTKAYDAGAAVEGLSLTVGAGEFVTVLGPSGSGKTTTLMMVAGLILPDRGRILLHGRDVTYAPPHRRSIGIVFQSYALFPNLTVYENVAFPLRVRRMGRQDVDDRVRRILDRLQLGGLESRRPTQISGGQQQRVALARALVFEPSLLLMDEPLAALDRKLRRRMQLEIKHLQRSLGIPVLYVTHDQEEALVMSDRVAVMRQGRLEQLGTVGAVYDRPASSFVADFIGEANVLRGRITDAGEEECEIGLGGGWTIRGMAPGPVPTGTEVLVTVRPERIEPGGGGGEADNTVDGELEETIFAGDVIKYAVRVPGGERLLVTVLNRDPARARRRGERVRLTWSAADTRVVRRDAPERREGERHV